MPDDFDNLRKRLQSLANDKRIAAERKALRATGKVIAEEVKLACPVQADTAEGLLAPGQLVESITTYVRIVNDAKASDGAEDTVTVMPNSKVTRDVARWLEYGHAGRTPDAKRTRPHPFLRPAEAACKEDAINTYSTVMAEELQKAFAKNE